jgi:hypothetical protein
VIVPDRPLTPSLQRLVTGAPASGPNHARHNEDLTHLIAYAAQPVISTYLPAVTTTPHSYYVAYRKTPGTRCLRITVEPHITVSLATRPALTCEVTVPGASVNWVETGSSLYLDGSQDLPVETPSTWDVTQYTNTLDVSGLTDGTWYDLKFLVTDTGTTASRGLYRIHVTEVPMADVDPVGAPTTEPGVNPAWLVSTDRNLIVDGTTALSYGTLRQLSQLEVARYQKRRLLQIVKPEATTLAWNVTGTAAIGSAPFPFGHPLHLRSRALYGTSVANVYTLRVRYINSASNKVTIRVAVTAAGGATTNYDFQLTNVASFTATTTDAGGSTMSVSIPGTGTDQECSIALYATNDAAGSTQISQLAFSESES